MSVCLTARKKQTGRIAIFLGRSGTHGAAGLCVSKPGIHDGKPTYVQFHWIS